MRDLQIPPQCKGCPRLVEPIKDFDSHAEDLADISAITPDMIENLRASIIDVLGYLGLSATKNLNAECRIRSIKNYSAPPPYNRIINAAITCHTPPRQDDNILLNFNTLEPKSLVHLLLY